MIRIYVYSNVVLVLQAKTIHDNDDNNSSIDKKTKKIRASNFTHTYTDTHTYTILVLHTFDVGFSHWIMFKVLILIHSFYSN